MTAAEVGVAGIRGYTSAMPSLRRVLRALLVGLVVLGLFPGTSELVETVEHLLHDGHAPHSAAHEQVARTEARHGSAEHGCSPLAHHCQCHASQIATPPVDVVVRLRSVAGRRLAPDAKSPLRHRAVAPPLPPPIA